ncbi:hypothetical protein [Agromyces aureus]|uniref:Uncharacterized protein n=1 Tax=Agromyces aureus TaxID=453304 RepID=A0A191WF30_9MICO|nr:hypothetical protein [Agromyces aureus]ANJ26832.1 hypothetical protein ATC03_08970 [Agromyces aureus]
MGKHEYLVPADTKRAAARGFIRTASQSLASAIPTSAIAISLTGEFWTGVALGVGGALVTAGLAGGASALSILSKGIPEDYQPSLPA